VGIALALAAAVLVGCGSSGRELREVPVGQTAPPRSTSSTVAAASLPSTSLAPGGAAGTATLLPDGWTAGGALPAISSCVGEALSPPLQWVGADPATTVELALIVTDPEADGFVHWLVTGIAPTDAVLQAGTAPAGVEGPNGGGGVGWFPLCPPAGEVHTYELELLGFATPPVLDPATPPAEQAAALRDLAATRSLLTGTFER
jgi:phosphatidylethanolamine-binding protein (PEBP) family uncharacterized protein